MSNNMYFISDYRKKLDAKEASATELATDLLAAMKKKEGKINAMITIDESSTLAHAKKADHMLANGQGRTLTGIPIVHKDNLCTVDFPTTAGSKILENFKSPYNAFVVQQTYDEGMVCMGKASCDEFAMGSSNEKSYYGKVHNPYELNHVPGGSSGGSAASVAAGYAPLSTGSDTGGSVRQPAAFCNLTGLKPTYGGVSRFGLIAFASSLDQVGPIAHSALDCGYLMDVISGHDARDSTSLPNPKLNYVDTIVNGMDVRSLRIGIPKQINDINLDDSVAKVFSDTIKQFEQMGATMVEVDMNLLEYAVPAYYIIAPAEASSNLARYNGALYGYRAPAKTLEEMYINSRTDGFGDEVKRRILIGTFVLSKGYQGAYYQKAINVKHAFTHQLQHIFNDVDFMITPTTPRKPFEFNQFKNPVQAYETDALTIPANLTGLPAVSFPAGFDGPLPIGVQLIGQHYQDHRLLALVHAYQQATSWHEQLATSF